MGWGVQGSYFGRGELDLVRGGLQEGEEEEKGEVMSVHEEGISAHPCSPSTTDSDCGGRGVPPNSIISPQPPAA